MTLLCSIPDCDRPAKVVGRQLCNAHHHRLLRHGDPLAGRTPEGEPSRYLEQVVLVHRGQDCCIWPYARAVNGYAHIRKDGSAKLVSRIVCESVHGTPPSDRRAASTDPRRHQGVHVGQRDPDEGRSGFCGTGTALRKRRKDRASCPEVPEERVVKTLFRVLDLETTGIPAEEDRHAVCEIGWIDVRLINGAWRVDDSPVSMLVNPCRPMPIDALAVHHITDAMLADAAPLDRGFLALMDGMYPDASCFVAHNTDFEREFFGGGDVPWLCTYKSALRIWPDAPSHSNQVLRYFLGLDIDSDKALPPHRAGPDAYVTAHVLKAILDTGTDIGQMIRWTKGPALLPRINFGKHKGSKWEDVPIDYLKWLADKSDMNRDVKANARHWIKQREAA